jgi:uncharacterized protein YbaP (TraB family)
MKIHAFAWRTFVLLFVALLPLAAAAQTTLQPPTPLLWKVSDADNSVYLLGSFHLLKPDDYPLSKDVDNAFADAQALMFEVDPAEMTSPDVAKIQKAATIADGKTLADVLPEKTWSKLQQMLQQSGTPIAQVEHVDPWMLMANIMVGTAQAMGFRQEDGLDMYLMGRAEQADKPVAGLETMDAQLTAMDSQPYAEQAHDLDEFLDNPQKSLGELNELHTDWRTGNVTALDTQMREKMAKETPESYRLLIVNRNNNWLPQIAQKLDSQKSGNTLIVVGAAHLIGPDGLIEKLKAKGYKVERICSACKADTK